ncbi:MAG: hypothetical protein ACK455_00835, partial [Bacteroidota bacterium]
NFFIIGCFIFNRNIAKINILVLFHSAAAEPFHTFLPVSLALTGVSDIIKSTAWGQNLFSEILSVFNTSMLSRLTIPETFKANIKQRLKKEINITFLFLITLIKQFKILVSMFKHQN